MTRLTSSPTTTKPRTSRSASARSGLRDQAVAPPAVVDLSGQVWTHPNPLHLYHWVDRRNALLLNLEAVAGWVSWN